MPESTPRVAGGKCSDPKGAALHSGQRRRCHADAPGIPAPPIIPLDPIRVALLQRLRDFPGAGELSQFDFTVVAQEMASSHGEELLEARLLWGGDGILDTVAIRPRPRGADWLRRYSVYGPRALATLNADL